jgi:hypothetical protein
VFGIERKHRWFCRTFELDDPYSKMEPELSRSNETIGARGYSRYIPDDSEHAGRLNAAATSLSDPL